MRPIAGMTWVGTAAAAVAVGTLLGPTPTAWASEDSTKPATSAASDTDTDRPDQERSEETSEDTDSTEPTADQTDDDSDTDDEPEGDDDSGIEPVAEQEEDDDDSDRDRSESLAADITSDTEPEPTADEQFDIVSDDDGETAEPASAIEADPSEPPHVWADFVTDPVVEARPLRSFVLDTLGLFGFRLDPAPERPNDPLLEGLWGLYRRTESFFANQRPTVTSAEVQQSVVTDDGLLHITFTAGFHDHDGDPLSFTSGNGTHGTVTANGDGTYTYVVAADFEGTDTISITAADNGFHVQGFLDSLRPNVSYGTTATVMINVSDDAPQAVVIPGRGNTWTVMVHSSLRRQQTTAEHPDHISVAGNRTSNKVVVRVTDDDWQRANPGAAVNITVTALNAAGETVQFALPVGQASNFVGLINTFVGPVESPQGWEDYIPSLPSGLTYTHLAGDDNRFVLLRSDGAAVSVNRFDDDPPELPPLSSGQRYTQVAVAERHIALLRDDGTVVVVNDDGVVPLEFPALPPGTTYSQLAAGEHHIVALRSDGAVVQIGGYYRFDRPTVTVSAPEAGTHYTQVAGGNGLTVLLRSDGTVTITGRTAALPKAPPLPVGVTYTQIAAASDNVMLLRSDGAAIIFLDKFREPFVVAPPAGRTYTRVAVGGAPYPTLLRSDGAVVTVRANTGRTLAAAVPPEGTAYTEVFPFGEYLATFVGPAAPY